MFCTKCKNEIADCTCPDIKERLESLKDSPYVGQAIRMNMAARALKNHPEGTALFQEDGGQLLVKVLEDNSDSEFLKYKLEVLEVIIPHPISNDPPIGEIFDVSHNKKYPQYMSWTLSR
jgi:hypothetical protein